MNMETSTTPDELAFAGKDFDEFREMMDATVLDSDLVRIDWLLEKIQHAEAQIAENNAVADRRIAMQEDFRQGENGKLERAIGWLTGEIGMIAPPDGDAMKEEYGKKSRVLAHGTFGHKMVSGDKVEITDPVQALAYAETNNLEVTTTTTRVVSKTVLKDHVKEVGIYGGTGWIFTPKREGFFVKAAE